MITCTRIIASLTIMAILLFSSTAYAEPKPWVWSWWESHWKDLDFEPYLENGKHPHNSQWDEQSWTPQQWAAEPAAAMDLVRGFYTADILRDQYMDDGVPVLEVGPGFYMLGGHDKRRIVQTIDYAYGVTAEKENGMFLLHDWQTGKAVGAYTRYGLQLQ